MKKYIIPFLLIFAMIAFMSCSDSTQLSEESDEEMVELSFGFSGEFDSIYQTPLQGGQESSRSLDDQVAAKNWYAIQVYDEDNKPYAYGFFDNTEDMKLLCVKGATYSFAVDMIPEGEDHVYKFSLVQSGWASIGNAFYYSKTEKVRYLGEGYLYMKYPTRDTFNRPAIDRFYGTLKDYKATTNGKISIELARSAFSVKFVAKDFTVGQLEISIDNAPTFYLKAEDGNEFEHFYSFKRLTSESEEIGVSIIWIDGEGKKIPIVAQNVSFARNTLTTLEFTVKVSESSNTFSITADEELVEGESIDLDTIDDLVDTEIETNP